MDAALSLDVTPIVASQVWHYWIAVPLAAGAILAVLATVIGYLRKVESLKYPRQ